MEEIKVKVGDTVIRRDGLKGKVIYFSASGSQTEEPNIPVVQFEDGSSSIIMFNSEYYLIGNTVLGNKDSEQDLEKTIADCEREIEEWKARKKQLRKQLWRLREEMVEDWKERKQARMNKKENQPAEEDTED